MATKTFNIGEYAVGGRIKVDINGKTVSIKALDWNSKKEVRGKTINSEDYNAHWQVDYFLFDLTSSYYAGKIMEWIKSKINLTNESL